MRTLVHYVQEVSASMIALEWTPEVRGRIERLAAVCDEVLMEALAEMAPK